MPPSSDNQMIDRAAAQSAADPRFKPVDLHIDRKDGLHIKWADGVESRLPLALLRKNCPCATCREQREQAAPAAAQARPGGGLSLSILPQNIDRATQFSDAKLVGRYALQITWGDGHSTGIYDFRYLRMIDPQYPTQHE